MVRAAAGTDPVPGACGATITFTDANRVNICVCVCIIVILLYCFIIFDCYYASTYVYVYLSD